MSDPPPRRAQWFQATDASSIGIEIALVVSVGAIGGFYLQTYVTHWDPWTLLLGMAVGIAAAIKALVRTARYYTRQLREANAKPDTQSAPPPEDPP